MSDSLPVVLLTNPILPSEMARLCARANVVTAPDAQPDTLRSLVRQADYLIVRAKLPDDIFDHAERLKGVVRHGVGLDMIPMDQAVARKIPVANMPGSNTASVVEYCLNAMLTLLRPLHRLTIGHDGVDWASKRPIADGVSELNGLTLGIVGVGAIGGALARVADALGMKVLGLNRNPAALPEWVQFADKQTLFSNADMVVLSCPLTPETRGLVDAATLARMRPSASIVNVSRGPVIDTPALLDALRNGTLRAAVLDVHDVQPVPPDLYRAGAGSLMLTPHVAGITASSMARMSKGSVDEVLRAIDGNRFLNLVNPEIYH